MLPVAGKKVQCASQLGQLQQLAIADPGLREFGFRLARRLGIAPRLIQFGEPIIGPAVIRRTRKGAPKRHSFSPVAPRSAPQPSGSCCSLWRWQASFHPEANAAFVGAAFADASFAPSDMRSPLEINNASPSANAAVQGVKSDICDRINAFIMSSNQGARSAPTRDSLG